MTTTGDAALTSSGISRPQAMSTRISTLELQVVKEKSARRPSTARQPRKDIISCGGHVDGLGLAAAVAVQGIAGRARRQLAPVHLLGCRSGCPVTLRPGTMTRTDRGIARHVHQGAQKRRGNHVLKRRPDLLVVIGKRLPAAWGFRLIPAFLREPNGPAATQWTVRKRRHSSD